MASGRLKKLICVFIYPDKTLSFTIEVDEEKPNCEAEAIQNLIIKENLNPYNLSFVIDNDKQTYRAEYLHSKEDFQTREHLIKWKPSSKS